MVITQSKKKLLLRTLVLATGVMVTVYYALQGGADYRVVFLAVGALLAALIVLGGHRGIQFGFVLWALSMAIGYRTFSVSKDLRIHPAEVLLWLLFACIFAHRQWVAENRVSFPLWVWLSFPFWVLGWWPLVYGDANWAAMFSEFRSFLLLIPLLVVAQIVLKKKATWPYLVAAFFAASTWIALIGVLEYWFPSVTRVFPAFIQNAQPQATADGFVRAQFSFWGNQSATFLCVLSFPLAIILFRWWRTSAVRLAIVAATVLQLVAIYIGGFRSVWLMVVIQVTTACLLGLQKRGLAVALLCVLVASVGYQFIPKTDERVLTTIAVLQGTPIDHSGQVRMDRATAALQRTLESPFGGGWHSAGWVHSDFLQVAANLGIIAALIFVAGYIFTFWKLTLAVKSAARIPSTDNGELGLSLLLSFIPVGGLLATQGVQVLPQLMLPVWFVWVLVVVWLRQRSAPAEYSYTYAPTNLYPAPNFQ